MLLLRLLRRALRVLRRFKLRLECVLLLLLLP